MPFLDLLEEMSFIARFLPYCNILASIADQGEMVVTGESIWPHNKALYSSSEGMPLELQTWHSGFSNDKLDGEVSCKGSVISLLG